MPLMIGFIICLRSNLSSMQLNVCGNGSSSLLVRDRRVGKNLVNVMFKILQFLNIALTRFFPTHFEYIDLVFGTALIADCNKLIIIIHSHHSCCVVYINIGNALAVMTVSQDSLDSNESWDTAITADDWVLYGEVTEGIDWL